MSPVERGPWEGAGDRVELGLRIQDSWVSRADYLVGTVLSVS